MAGSTIVPDASLFNKLFLDEDDRDSALEFFEALEGSAIKLIAPRLLIYEVLAVCLGQGVDGGMVLGILNDFQRNVLEVRDLTPSEWNAAVKIAETGHPKSGFPSLYDAAYHALAIETGGTFITTDRRHIAKTGSFGHVALLKDWKHVLSAENDIGE